MIEEVRRLIDEMKATGKYNESRLDPDLFVRLHGEGRLLFRFDRSAEPSRIVGVIGLWDTRDPHVFEVGTFYVPPKQERNGIGKELFAEVMQVAPRDAQLFSIMRDARAMRIAAAHGFNPVSRINMPDVEAWASKIGLGRRLPATACSRMTRPSKGERWLLVRPVKGARG